MSDLNPQQLILLAILASAFALLITERIRVDLTAVLLILALALSGMLSPEEALSGLSSEPAVVTAAIFVMSGALFYTGLSDRLGGWISRLAGSGYNRMVLVIMPAVALLSAFTHHVTVTAVMLPVTLRLCRKHGIAPSKLLMPMSFAASLSTTITIMAAVASFFTPIGHHGNLLIYGPGRYQFSDFLRVGTPLTLVVGAVVTWMALLLWGG